MSTFNSIAMTVIGVGGGLLVLMTIVLATRLQRTRPIRPNCRRSSSNP